MSGMPRPLLSIAEARRRVLDAVTPLETERVPVADALDRVLAQDVVATTDVPPFPSSAMDGYAVQAGPAPRELTLSGESRAGVPARRGSKRARRSASRPAPRSPTAPPP